MLTSPKRSTPVVTYDTRPLPQHAANRSDDVAPGIERRNDPVTQQAERAVERFRRTASRRGSDGAVEPTEELLLQVGSIFAYAMLGAVLFHGAWWLLSAV